MSDNNLFLVSFILDNQPQSIEVNCHARTLSVAEARNQVIAEKKITDPGSLTDVQVTEIPHPKKNKPTPALRVQP
ncbi:hypothetical protein [Halopseudomonas pelagia]|uniref:Uncharacterized protein n=1 Tax=Halopseudomonas pelagia TaxID=553151 RepID=A0AA91U3G8_9GAMM|nr:hypothetical protein [Halopseudomonas pelagia]PCC99867.1 hypothetical protein CO192_08595 [Halopseudomonas pelagia]QFY56271.1 hypothetical protein EAO82_07800 [Halopseudomonas pelagia]